MDTSKFIGLILDLHSKYGGVLGIHDVYAYSALGRVIKAVGTVIISPRSPLSLDGNPKSVFLYLMSNSSMVILIDLKDTIDIPLSNCVTKKFEISNDIHNPPNNVTVIEILNCDSEFLHEVAALLRKYGVKALPAFVSELGESGFKLLFRGSIQSLSTLVRYIVVLTLVSQLSRDLSNEELIKDRINNILRSVKLPSP